MYLYLNGNNQNPGLQHMLTSIKVQISIANQTKYKATNQTVFLRDLRYAITSPFSYQ